MQGYSYDELYETLRWIKVGRSSQGAIYYKLGCRNSIKDKVIVDRCIRFPHQQPPSIRFKSLDNCLFPQAILNLHDGLSLY
jgi:hypothetical protein